MVSIYDTRLTSLKENLKVNKNIPVNNQELFVNQNNGSLKITIPLFHYDNVENTSATTFKLLSNNCILLNKNFTGYLFFNSDDRPVHLHTPMFNIFKQVNNIVVFILSDEYANIFVGENVEVYTSDDNVDYVLTENIITDSFGQGIYYNTNVDVSYVKFKYGEVWSSYVEL